MSALGGLVALVVLLICVTPRPDTHAATPTPASVSEDAFGGVAEPGTVPIFLFNEHHGKVDDRLLGASTPVAASVAVHQTRLQQGQRVMQPLPDGLVIPAGKRMVLEAGTAHLMLMGLQEGLIQGQTFPLTLHFARAGDVRVTARVRRKVDAADVPELPAVTSGDLTISLVSASPPHTQSQGGIDREQSRAYSAIDVYAAILDGLAMHASGAAAMTAASLPCICTTVRRADRALNRLYDQALRPSGLLTTQYALLSRLARAPGPISHHELAEAMAMASTTLTRNLTPLARDGFVHTEPGSDRRARLVSISPQGRAALERARPLWRSVQERLIAETGEARVAHLLAELNDLVARVQQ